ncbi:E3 ubiquitin-protein ligase lubel-like [Xyrauchen texanus]|uniref:E3 ubiquitin-protein ligase lubel-like n=1 Tax=Xyrauchen texanus TaxID=154827 RepID=UPI002242AFA2|nr:E3 ubiquitin-protein ligase lubel-like [Xyrauchen texanus]XP_051981700.1 E3 ubiquitin-protein ligase lubel-like [Xyrauchen texanus]
MNIPKCPGCQQFNIRKLDGQRAVCKSCSKVNRRVFQFCWACQREWPQHALTTDSCVLPNCALRAALLSVKQISDPVSSVRGCPYFRACPGCKALLTHNSVGCPNIICPHCHTEFCFRCMRPQCYDNDEYDESDTDEDEEEDIEIEQCVIADNNEILLNLEL